MIEIKEHTNAIVGWAVFGLLATVGTLAALNARSYIEGIAAEVYQAKGLEPSEIKGELIQLSTQLENVEGDVSEIKEDFRTLISRL